MATTKKLIAKKTVAKQVAKKSVAQGSSKPKGPKRVRIVLKYVVESDSPEVLHRLSMMGAYLAMYGVVGCLKDEEKARILSGTDTDWRIVK